MIVRELPLMVHALDQKAVFTCSTGDAQTSSAINGQIIDLLSLGTGRDFEAATPYLNVYSTWGSTALDRAITVTIKLQHGTSSAMGDAADYSTAQQAAARNFFTTAQTTTFASWSTCSFVGAHSGTYDIRGCNRYIRPVYTLTNDVTSTTTGANVERLLVEGGIAFHSPNEYPVQSQIFNPNTGAMTFGAWGSGVPGSPLVFSTATSTTT